MTEAERSDERNEELRVAGALRRLAAETRPPRPLPTAGQLWWRAEVIRRLVGKPEEEVRRSLRPALWGEMAGLALGLVVLLGFIGLQASDLLEPLGRRIAAGDLRPLVLLGLLPLAAASLLGLLVRRS
jgi:hypothetical protein